MNKTIALLTIATALAVSTPADAGGRNLTGAWNNDGDTWVIAHVGNSADFSTSDYDDTFGLLTMNFSGFVNSNGDRFSYRGTGETIRLRMDNVVCRLNPSMRASGYVSGEFGGRIIHMQSCQVTAAIRCVDEDTGRTKSDTIYASCSGTWR